MPTPAPDERPRVVAPRLQGFAALMPHRIREVLLVASGYDSFILEEEGQLTDLLLQEYDRLNLRYAPRLNATPSATEALALLNSDRRFDLVIVTMHPGAMDPADFARAVHARTPRTPVVLLGYDNRELQELIQSPDAAAFDQVFVWTGDARILVAIVSSIEDTWNVEHDVRAVGVEVIILVEDSVHFLSSVLPILYAKLMRQSQRLISEGITLAHKVLRMRARPKVLVASTYEEAWNLYQRYREHVLGVISDLRFPHEGRLDAEAGAALAAAIRADKADVPILLLSTDPEGAIEADRLGVGFASKDSPQFRQEIERFMLGSFGFGPFIFRWPDGGRVAEAQDLRELRQCLETVPDESIRFHSDGNHFSTWLKARTEFRLAAALRPRRVSDYPSITHLRRDLISSLDAFLRESHRDAIGAFDPETFGTISGFARIGGGSLGGKARGLAFLNMLLRRHGVGADRTDVNVTIPATVVIGTELFDQFILENDLIGVTRDGSDAETIRRVFAEAALPASLVEELEALVAIMDYPVAVRSSSLLEDSQHQPFAGVYETYMLANANPDPAHRLADLSTAIKLVYASTFSPHAQAYLEATPQRPEKEKMAVMIQQLIGRRRNDHFYPTLSGVAQSYNYYPFGRVEPRDGAAVVAVGLGRLVVEGAGGLRFCPRYPQHLPQLSSVDDVRRNSQKAFDALRLDPQGDDPHHRLQPERCPIDALDEEVLEPVASVYVAEDDAVHDGLSRRGTPLVTFAGILKHGRVPLASLLQEMLAVASAGMGAPVEIEFAADIDPDPTEPPVFACLQLRPLTVERNIARVNFSAMEKENLLCLSPRALGNGRIEGIRDVVCVLPEEFDRRHSVETADDISRLNHRLRAQGRPYLLIGPGRWGSADPHLGIPVNWTQIAGARIIVETRLEGIAVAPSDGSHFFHNMTAFRVGYMTAGVGSKDGFIDWSWLLDRTVVEELPNGVRWFRLDEPVVGLIDGATRQGAVVKRDGEAAASAASDASDTSDPDA